MPVEGVSLDPREAKLLALLSAPNGEMQKLRESVWSGCTGQYVSRALAWKILLGYLPLRHDRRNDVLQRKREEYRRLLRDNGHVMSNASTDPMKQVHLDIPRTHVFGVNLLKSKEIQSLLERVLILWAIRHPSCSYVQGINDIAIPLLVVLLQSHFEKCVKGIAESDVLHENEEFLQNAEADLYWLLTNLLQDLQDNYTFSQPGIQKMNMRMRDILQRVDLPLHKHFEKESIDTLHVTFRWFNCLLVRELECDAVLRVWDSCLAEDGGFRTFLVYVCSALLLRHSRSLQQMDFQEMHIFFTNGVNISRDQNMTAVETILSEAFILKSLFDSSPNHLKQ